MGGGEPSSIELNNGNHNISGCRLYNVKLIVSGSSSASIVGNAFFGDIDCIEINGTPALTVNQNDFFVAPSKYGIRNLNSLYSVLAANNYWGSSSGPAHVSNPMGTGVKVSDGVMFVPYATVPFGTVPALLTPLILVPGIMGSPMYNDVNGNNILEDGERRWISLGSPILDLELNADGSAAVGGTNITVSPIRSTNPSVTIQTEISQLPLKGPFLELVRNLEQGLGYRLDRTKTSHENENLFVFTYDWRKSIREAATGLAAFVEFVLSRTGSSKVDIIAHSMGGLVVKSYFRNPTAMPLSKVNKVIFVGTPHLGSANAIYSMRTGIFLEWYNDWVFKDGDIKRLENNYASCYHLFPSKIYSSMPKAGAVLFEQNGSRWMGRDYEGVLGYFKGSPGGFTYNSEFLENMSPAQDELEITDFGSVQVTNIAGIGKGTIGRVKQFANGKISPSSTLNGDGTVPLISSRSVTPTIVSGTKYVSGVKHMDLPSHAKTWAIIRPILESAPVQKPMENAVSIADAEPLLYTSATQLTVYGNARITVLDSLGRRSATMGDSIVALDIPESEVVTRPGISLILLPRGQAYLVSIDSPATSVVDIVADDVDNGDQRESILFDSVAVLPTSSLAFSVRNVGPGVLLYLDTNGDGITDTVYKPSSYVISSAYDNDDEKEGRGPTNFILNQNYPNPFNPSTVIRYGLPSRAHVILTVFNTLGQQISVLQNGEQDPGYYEVRFDGTNLPSGVYFYRMQAGSYVETKRLLLLK